MKTSKDTRKKALAEELLMGTALGVCGSVRLILEAPEELGDLAQLAAALAGVAPGDGGARWVPDVCRHSFASFHAAFFRDLPGSQLEMGHRDCSLLRNRYVSPALCRGAARFWGGVGLRLANLPAQ